MITEATRTFGFEDEPTITVLPGHVTAAKFSKAFRNEGWESDPIQKDEISHEYGILTAKSYKKCKKEDPNALPMTVMEW